MLKTFETCPKKYFFRYVQNIAVPQPASFFERGKKIHALAHYYLCGADISNLLRELSDSEKEIWQSLLNNEFFQKSYVASEYNLSAKVGEFWVGGRLDALMKDGDDYYILDYKTGAIPKNPETDYQTMVYLVCADKILKDYNSLNFIYIDLKNKRNFTVCADKNKIAEYSETLENVCLKISSEEVFSGCSVKCDFCEYKKFCY